MRVLKTKRFSRFARQEGIGDDDLCEAVDRADRGLIDADLGGGVIKQRIARPGEGKSGGFRSIVLFRSKEIAFFVYGFSKSDRGNVNASELKEFKILAQHLLTYTRSQVETALKTGAFTEVKCNENENV